MTAFDRLETRVSAACVKKLANAEADFGGGKGVSGIFRNPHAEGFGGVISGSKPSIEVQSDDIVGIDRGAPVNIGGIQYTVYDLRPSDSMTIVDLEPV